MCIRHSVLILASCCLLAICSAQADTVKTLQDVNTVNDTINHVVNSPAGGLIPEPARTILETVVGLVGLIVGFFLKKQKATAVQTLGCVTKAVENSGAAGEVVKKNVAALMGDPESPRYKTLNAVVDKAKNA